MPRLPPLRSILRPILLLGLAGGLAGCLQPVNTPSLGFASSRASTQLAEVSVGKVDGYLGYQLKAELDYLLTNGAPAKSSRYALNIKLAEGKALSIIDLPTGRPQVVTIQVQATYELKDTRTNRIKASGRTFASGSYDRSQQRFATIRSQRDAEERIAKSLAERLRTITLTSLLAEQDSGAGAAPPLLPNIDPTFEPGAVEPGDET